VQSISNNRPHQASVLHNHNTSLSMEARWWYIDRDPRFLISSNCRCALIYSAPAWSIKIWSRHTEEIKIGNFIVLVKFISEGGGAGDMCYTSLK